jgi:hypothetical protein
LNSIIRSSLRCIAHNISDWCRIVTDDPTQCGRECAHVSCEEENDTEVQPLAPDQLPRDVTGLTLRANRSGIRHDPARADNSFLQDRAVRWARDWAIACIIQCGSEIRLLSDLRYDLGSNSAARRRRRNAEGQRWRVHD